MVLWLLFGNWCRFYWNLVVRSVEVYCAENVFAGREMWKVVDVRHWVAVWGGDNIETAVISYRASGAVYVVMPGNSFSRSENCSPGAKVDNGLWWLWKVSQTAESLVTGSIILLVTDVDDDLSVVQQICTNNRIFRIRNNKRPLKCSA